MCIQNLKFVALPVPEIIGGTQKNLGSPWIRLYAPFLKNFSWACVRMDPVNVWPNLKSVALAVPDIIVIAVLGWGCELPILGKERA